MNGSEFFVQTIRMREKEITRACELERQIREARACREGERRWMHRVGAAINRPMEIRTRTAPA